MYTLTNVISPQDPGESSMRRVLFLRNCGAASVGEYNTRHEEGVTLEIRL